MAADLELAYMAGVVDSDGFITIRHHAANRDRPWSNTMSEQIGAGQTTPEAMTLLHDTFGGVLKVRTRNTPGDWKPIHYWLATNREAVAAVRALRPFLRVKAQHADLLLALRAHKDLGRAVQERVGVRSLRLTDEATEYRLGLWRAIRRLNDRRASNTAL